MNRAGIYLLYDPLGRVNDYVLDVLDSLEAFCAYRLVVVNGALAAGEKERLLEHCDAVLERANEDYDVGGYRAALENIGWESLCQFDEVILMNHTFFAPIRPWAPIFAQAEKQEVAFWGLSDHAELKYHPFLPGTRMPRHLQSHFIAVRRELLEAKVFRRYWEEMVPIRSYRDSITYHESRFTEYFARLGFRWWVAFPHTDFGADNPSICTPIALMKAGCPVLKRRIFFQDPVHMAAVGVDASAVMRAAEEFGFSADRILAGVVRTSSPRFLWANARLTEVLGTTLEVVNNTDPLFVHTHVTSSAGIEALENASDVLPQRSHIIVTYSDLRLREGLIAQGKRCGLTVEIKEVPRGAMPSLLAFFLAAPEVSVFTDALILELGENACGLGEGALFSSLAQLEWAFGLFCAHPNLGLVMPMPPLSLQKMERAWHSLYLHAREIAQEWGISLAFDTHIPLVPGPGPLLFRSVALRGFALEKEKLMRTCAQGSAAMDAVMMLLAYRAAQSGYHSRYLLPSLQEWRVEKSVRETVRVLTKVNEGARGHLLRRGVRKILRFFP